MRPFLKKWGPRFGYVAFYLVTFVFFASLLFPYDVLKEKIVLDFNAQQKATGAQQELSIDELGWYWFNGVRAKGIKITSAPTPPAKDPAEIRIDEARVKVGLLSKLVGNTSVNFQLDALGGHVSGHYSESGSEKVVEKPNGSKETIHKDRAVEVELDQVELHDVDALTQMIGLPLEGKISGTVKLTMPEGRASKGSGSVDLEGQDVAIGDGKAKLKGALEWPKLAVGTLTFTAEAKDGALKVTKFGANGKDLDLSGDGKVQMRDLANESSLDVNLKFRINDSYRSKSDMTKALFGAPGTTKGGDVEMVVPEMKQAKRPDGFYAFHVRGLLGHPGFDPAIGGGPPSLAPSFGMVRPPLDP
jgi:type II secretion system protein N